MHEKVTHTLALNSGIILVIASGIYGMLDINAMNANTLIPLFTIDQTPIIFLKVLAISFILGLLRSIFSTYFYTFELAPLLPADLPPDSVVHLLPK